MNRINGLIIINITHNIWISISKIKKNNLKNICPIYKLI
jgi:hypothetical protein